MYNDVLASVPAVTRHAWTPLVAGHALAATTAVALGAVVLLRRRRGDRIHRRLGAAWAAAMYATVLTSFGLRMVTPGRFSWLHILSAWTAVSVTTALWAARTGRRRLHAAHMVGSFTGLVSAGLAAALVPGRLVPELVLSRPAVAATALAAVVGLTGLVTAVASLSRRTQPGAAAPAVPATRARAAAGARHF